MNTRHEILNTVISLGLLIIDFQRDKIGKDVQICLNTNGSPVSVTGPV